MLDLLAATAVVTALVAAGLGLLYAVTVVPFLLAVGTAERRGASTGRWALLALAGVLVALAAAALALRADAPRPVAVVLLALAYAVPLAARAVRPGSALAGEPGRYERPL